MYKLLFIISCCVFQDTFAIIPEILDSFIEPCIKLNEECPSEKVSFWLYTRQNKDVPHELKTGNLESLERAPFVKGSPIFITIHGFNDSQESTPTQQIKPELLARGDFNIIAVDYSSLVKSPCCYYTAPLCYSSAVSNLKGVAKCTAKFLDFMLKTMDIPLEQVHVIGFSLGAQVSGMIANFIQIGKLKHITGLDPALPGFRGLGVWDLEWKLDESDADFVDVIHTNILGNGKLIPSGNVDFYVNGGLLQPECGYGVIDNLKCSHSRAAQYYAESINTKIGFYGQEYNAVCQLVGNCKTMVMGFDVPHNASGVYFVDTNSEPPFAKGMP